MKKYWVRSKDFKTTYYDGFDFEKVKEFANEDTVLDEFDFDEPELEDDGTYAFYNHDYLTDIYGYDEGIKKEMKQAIEYITGKKVIDFELSYDDPGLAGDDASFFADNVQFEE